MAYSKQNWENLPSENTPISAARLAHMESQYDEAVSYVDSKAQGAGVFNVMDFGAVGDGVSDDSQALRDALTHSKGGTLEFPRGKSFKVERPLNLYSNSIIELNGSSIIRGFGEHPSGKGLLFIIGQENIVLRGGTLDGNGGEFPSDPPGFNIISGWDISDITISDCVFRDVVAFHAIDVYSSTGLRISRNRFEGFKLPPTGREFSEAIQLDPAGTNRGVIVEGNLFTSSGTAGFGPWPCGVGNHATSAGDPVTSSGVQITGNTFDGCTFAGIHALYWSDVQVSGNYFKDCKESVRVSQGSHAGQFSRGILVSGNSVTQAAGGLAFNIRMAEGVMVSGNAVRGGATGCRLEYVSNGLVSDNVFSDLSQNAVLVNEASYPASTGTGITRRITISGNQGSNLGFRGVHFNCAGRDASVTGNLFSGVSNTSTPRAGIQFDSGWRGGLIDGNTVSDDPSLSNKPNYGVYLLSSSHSITVGTNRLFGTLEPIRDESSP